MDGAVFRGRTTFIALLCASRSSGAGSVNS